MLRSCLWHGWVTSQRVLLWMQRTQLLARRVRIQPRVAAAATAAALPGKGARSVSGPASGPPLPASCLAFDWAEP